MSEMSHDFGEPPPPARIQIADYKIATNLAEKLIQSGVPFRCIPVPDEQRCTFEVDPIARTYVEQQLQSEYAALSVDYKGHHIRCFGAMSMEQNVWWATDDDEGIVTNGFESWAKAVVYFIDEKKLPIVELAAV